jgi:hypothetical protein
MAHRGPAQRAREHHPDLPALARAGAQPGRKRLAIAAPELALKPGLFKLQRDRRRRRKPSRSNLAVAFSHRRSRSASDFEKCALLPAVPRSAELVALADLAGAPQHERSPWAHRPLFVRRQEEATNWQKITGATG